MGSAVVGAVAMRLARQIRQGTLMRVEKSFPPHDCPDMNVRHRNGRAAVGQGDPGKRVNGISAVLTPPLPDVKAAGTLGVSSGDPGL